MENDQHASATICEEHATRAALLEKMNNLLDAL